MVDSTSVAELNAIYLLSGDDDPKIDAWRSRLRTRAEAEGGPGALEVFDARASRPAEVAVAVASLSFSTGNRYVLAEGVEAWKAGELESVEREVADMPPATVLVLVARGKAPARLAKAVEKAGGKIHHFAAPKPWEMPRWAADRAREEGLHLDPEAVKALVAAVGTRQQRIARELEKLAVAAHPRHQLTAADVEQLVSGEVSIRVYDLADALVSRDLPAALALAEELAGQSERPARLVFPLARRLREVHRAAELLEAGVPEQKVAERLDMRAWAAKRTVSQAAKADRLGLERAIGVFAELELELRGGGELDDDTALSLALARAAA